jgi:hypothetical protein
MAGMAGTKANDRVAKIIYDELIAVKTDADKRRSAAVRFHFDLFSEFSF